MSKKRAAASELNSDNWADDDEPEEAGTFKAVDPEVLSKRVIKIARRKLSKPNTEQSKLFTNFSGFVNQNTSSPDVKNTFRFLANLNGTTNQTTNSPASSPMPSLTSSSISPTSTTAEDDKPDITKPSKESIHSTKIKALNESVLEWITKWVSKNPTCVLTPVFRDYEKHLETIKTEVAKTDVESKPNEIPSNFKFNFIPAFNNASKPSSNLSPTKSESPVNATKFPESTSTTGTINSSWLKCGIASSGDSNLNNKPAPLFNFSGKPSFLQNLGAPGSIENDIKKDPQSDDETPIVNDFKPVTEDNALYTQRVKVFVKSQENYSDRGVGNLFIKEATNEKGDKIYQAIVRADTTLGNIIFNIRITKDIPTKRVGKNNVMLVCLPTPDLKSPVPVLLRVKTEEDADKLLAEINKYK